MSATKDELLKEETCLMKDIQEEQAALDREGLHACTLGHGKDIPPEASQILTERELIQRKKGRENIGVKEEKLRKVREQLSKLPK